MQKLQAMRLAQDEVIKIQKQSFQTELKRIKEKFQQVELRSKPLENEIKTLNSKDKAPEYNLALSILRVKVTQIIPSNLQVINRGKVVKPSLKSYAQIMAINAAQNPLKNVDIKVISSIHKQKGILSNMLKVEPEKR